MTTPITYPPTVKKWGIDQALQNQNTWISYIGVDGSIFYLAGPLQPVAGAQDGLVLKKHMGLMSPFEMLELRGARQDGATWTDAVYDVGDIMLIVEASGIGPQNIRDVIRQWISAWSPKKTGLLSVFTPDMGEWWARVRQGKNVGDSFEKDYTWNGKQIFTWEAKNYDAYWESVDSTSTFGLLYASASDDFTARSNATTLGSNWTTTLTPGIADGTCGIRDGAAVLLPSGNGVPYEARNVFHTGSATDNQVVNVHLSPATLAHLFDILDPGAFIDVWARMNSAGTTGVRLRLGLLQHSLTAFVAGTAVWTEIYPNLIPPLWNENYTLVAGTESGKYNFRVLRDGFQIMNITDTAQLSSVGSTFRRWGFGLSSNTILGYTVPQPIAQWSAADNLAVTQSGYCPLTNRGDVEAWPRYLCYGPGTFTFSNGPSSTDLIHFGPLEDGQVVLVTTEPRLRSVIDLTPNQASQAQQTIWQQLLAELISFVTNNNVPPFLRQFESFFGIVPPQGNLYSLLNGRFTNPIPASTYGVAPPTQHVAVGIVNGSPMSRIVTAITPRRRWPL